jgi:hypothetical protein
MLKQIFLRLCTSSVHQIAQMPRYVPLISDWLVCALVPYSATTEAFNFSWYILFAATFSLSFSQWNRYSIYLHCYFVKCTLLAKSVHPRRIQPREKPGQCIATPQPRFPALLVTARRGQRNVTHEDRCRNGRGLLSFIVCQYHKNAEDLVKSPRTVRPQTLKGRWSIELK